MKKLFIFAVALAAMFACTSKQDQFNEEVKAIMERNNNVGLALVAVNNGEVVLNAPVESHSSDNFFPRVSQAGS